jgi:bifunctional UDP-N-acetylglucosamine pyrophosphorylase/glucosamine-1-phosphate N-acetyltransferase
MAKLVRVVGERIVAVDENETAGTIADQVARDQALRAATAKRLMDQGVTIFRPDTCVLDAEVEIAAGTVIEPYVQLLGLTKIGAECLIRSYTVLDSCIIGDQVLIRQSCVLTDSSVEQGAKIGPFAHLRPGSEIGPDAHVGNFVETKKAKLGKGAKANHLTYLGDAEIGEGSNIGAGTITCNYDGVNKHMTHIGKRVFVGSDSTLVAPLTIEDDSYIGAGSCITKNVPSGSLALSRPHQIVKEGWVAARRERGKSKT